MLKHKFLAAMALGLALTGCVENTSTASKAAEGAEVQPGPANVDMVSAVSLFDRVCAKTAPRFSGAPKALASLPVRQHPDTGTFYHQNLNLSFKVTVGRGCSMVFVSKERPGTLALAFGSTLSSDGNVSMDPSTNNSFAKGPAGTEMNFITRKSAGRGARYFVVSLATGN